MRLQQTTRQIFKEKEGKKKKDTKKSARKQTEANCFPPRLSMFLLNKEGKRGKTVQTNKPKHKCKQTHYHIGGLCINSCLTNNKHIMLQLIIEC